MKAKCDACGRDLSTKQGQIIVLWPAFVNGVWKEYHFCRPCFIRYDPRGLIESEMEEAK